MPFLPSDSQNTVRIQQSPSARFGTHIYSSRSIPPSVSLSSPMKSYAPVFAILIFAGIR